MSEQGHVETPSVVVLRMKSAGQLKRVCRAASLGGACWACALSCGISVPSSLNKVQLVSPCRNRKLEPVSRNRYGFHPRALTQRFSNDGLVFHRVKSRWI